ncbi:MAG: hypothetical protein GY835_25945 [bacterium]|nr:hypothetical protein [bacterium]
MGTQKQTTKGEQLQNMVNTVWGLHGANRDERLPLTERVNLLRTHYELQRIKEEELDIPQRDRSFLYLQEEPTAAVLLVPGGHSTPSQYFHLGRHLYRSGMTVYSSLLPNEAAVGSQSGGVPWQLSLAELEMRYDMLELLDVPIHIVSSSFGSILALILARKCKAASLTLLSPPLRPNLKLSERIALTWRRIIPRLFERMISSSPHRWLADRYNAVRQASQKLGEIRAPILAIHAKDNPELSPDGLKVIKKAFGENDARIILLDKGGHGLLKGEESGRVQQEVLSFIQKHQGRRGDSSGRGFAGGGKDSEERQKSPTRRSRRNRGKRSGE